MPPRFTLAQPQQPPALRSRFTPVTRPTSGTSSTSQSNPALAGLGITRGLNSLLGLGARFTGSPNLGMASQGLSGILGLGTGAMQLGQGRTVPGALSMTSGAGNLAGAAGRFGQMPALAAGGGALGGVAGLAGGGYSLAQGDIPSGFSGLLSGGAGLSGALGATTMASALGALSLPLVIGKIAEIGVNAGLGEGPFGQTKLPFGRGNQFSSADNLASQMSMYRGMIGSNMLIDAIQKAQSPQSLLQLAAMGRNPADPQYNTLLAPHGEVQFYHPQYGDPTQFQTVVNQILQTGNPNLLRQFISGVNVQTGEGGATTVNPIATDWYRRNLVASLPEQLKQPMLQAGGLFAPMPADQPEFRANDYLQAITQLNQQYAPSGGPVYSREQAIEGLIRGNVGHEQINQLFRPPEQLIDRATAEQLIASNPAFLATLPQPVNTTFYTSNNEPYTISLEQQARNLEQYNMGTP